MIQRQGVIDLSRKADGRLRELATILMERSADPLVPARLVERYGLRTGMSLTVEIGEKLGAENNGNGHGRDRDGGYGRGRRRRKSKASQESAGAPRVESILSIEGQPAEGYKPPRLLEQCTALDPQPQIKLEYPGCPPACRLIDLFCPIGFGQRGLIVSPPKAGKTTLLQQIAASMLKNHPEVIVFALLIDERPEEVTDFRRNVPCEVIASSNDHDADRHVGLAIVAIERCKRLAEQGKRVVVLLDSLTRIGRAFNTAPSVKGTGRTLSGGIDVSALSIPKQLFGAARNTEEAGSLTILATCLVDTGSRGDQLIFEEFKGTGNMELILDRDIANQRLFPAINLAASGTRKEHLLVDAQTLATTTALRRRLIGMQPRQQVEQLLQAIQRFPTNADLVGKNAPSPTAVP